MTVHRDRICHRKLAETQFYSLPKSMTPTLDHKKVLMLKVSNHEEKRENSAAEDGRHMLGSELWAVGLELGAHERNVYYFMVDDHMSSPCLARLLRTKIPTIIINLLITSGRTIMYDRQSNFRSSEPVSC